MALPTLPTGFTWHLQAEDAAVRQVTITLLHNNLIIHEANVCDLDKATTQADFNTVIEDAANKVFDDAALNRFNWLAAITP